MAIQTTAFTAGSPCWVDLGTSDASKSMHFYGELFGWEFQLDTEDVFGGYTLCLHEGHQVAGLMQLPPEMRMGPDGFTTYFASDDIDATVAAATALGANVFAPPMGVAELGSMAILGDPAGGIFGIWQSGSHTGFQKYDEPNSVSWNEYHAQQFIAVVDFYRQLLGWEIARVSYTADFRYYTGQVENRDVAGLMDSATMLAAGEPGGWAIYFRVADADAIEAKTVELGGAVVMSAEDTPYGRMASLLDSTGAAFRVIQAPPTPAFAS